MLKEEKNCRECYMRANVERPPDVELLLQLCDVVERTLSSVHSAIAPANLGQLECLKLLSFGNGSRSINDTEKDSAICLYYHGY